MQKEKNKKAVVDKTFFQCRVENINLFIFMTKQLFGTIIELILSKHKKN